MSIQVISEIGDTLWYIAPCVFVDLLMTNLIYIYIYMYICVCVNRIYIYMYIYIYIYIYK